MLAICGLPQAIKCFKDKQAYGYSAGTLWLWGGGELGFLFYVPMMAQLRDVPVDWPLVVSYILNLVIASVIAYYKIYPKVDNPYGKLKQ